MPVRNFNVKYDVVKLISVELLAYILGWWAGVIAAYNCFANCANLMTLAIQMIFQTRLGWFPFWSVWVDTSESQSELSRDNLGSAIHSAPGRLRQKSIIHTDDWLIWTTVKYSVDTWPWVGVSTIVNSVWVNFHWFLTSLASWSKKFLPPEGFESRVFIENRWWVSQFICRVISKPRNRRKRIPLKNTP